MAGDTLNLVTYLEELPPIKLSKIYTSQWTCQAVLRSLPPLAKQYVLRLLFVSTAAPESIVSSWAHSTGRSKHDAALVALQRLQVLQSQPDRSGSLTYILHPSFQQQLQLALCMRQPPGSSAPKEITDSAPSAADSSSYSTKQWETLLLFLLGASRGLPAAPAYMEQKKLDIPQLLANAGLISSDGKVTRAGFQFLLSDTHQQVWQLLREYISLAEASSGSELSAVISFLLQLGFHSGPAAFADLPLEERRIAADMAALGVLCPFKGPDNRVYVSPTMLARSICAGGSSGTKAADGHIIVETNYKVYAYTASQIRMKILQLFVRLEVILPNLIVGTITSESVLQALSNGISASQIVTYLRQHASPHVANRTPVVPEVVGDQIRLWESEQSRVRHCDACLFDNFDSDEIFNKTCNNARKIGVWLWQDSAKRRLVTTMEGYDPMRKFIKANK